MPKLNLSRLETSIFWKGGQVTLPEGDDVSQRGCALQGKSKSKIFRDLALLQVKTWDQGSLETVFDKGRKITQRYTSLVLIEASVLPQRVRIMNPSYLQRVERSGICQADRIDVHMCNSLYC